MRRTTAAAIGLMTALGAAAPASAQEPAVDERQARLWFDRGDEPVVERGERMRLYYRTSHDAYVAVVHIDTDGTANLVFPRSPDENHYVRGGRDYRLLFPRSPYWYVEDAPGIGYFFLVASPEPFDFGDLPYSYYDGGWDLSRVGRRVYSDPYVAMDEYVASLIPDWDVVPYALDFATYHVDRRHDYPRFLCYDCHGFRPYQAWNPYYSACTTFQVVVYDDPYFYPARRYRGRDVVWVRPPRAGLPRFAFKERPAGAEGVVVVQQRPRSEPEPRARRPADGGATPPVTGRRGGDAEARPPLTRWRNPASGEGRSPDVERRPAARPPAAGGGTGSAEPRRPADALRRPGTAGRPSARPGEPSTRPADRPSPGVRPQGPGGGDDGPARRPVLRRRPSGGADRGGSGGSAPIVGPRDGRSRPAAPVVGGSRPEPPGEARPRGGRPDAPSARPGGSAPSRPSAGARPGGPSGSSGARPSVRPRPGGSSGSSGSRPSVRPRPGGSSGSSGSRPSARPRPGGSSGSSGSRPSVRPRPGGSSGATPRVRTRRGGGGEGSG